MHKDARVEWKFARDARKIPWVETRHAREFSFAVARLISSMFSPLAGAACCRVQPKSVYELYSSLLHHIGLRCVARDRCSI